MQGNKYAVLLTIFFSPSLPLFLSPFSLSHTLVSFLFLHHKQQTPNSTFGGKWSDRIEH